jgi:hypothetical protein
MSTPVLIFCRTRKVLPEITRRNTPPDVIQ